MSGFFRYPHTPHLRWLGTVSPRDDKVLSPAEATALLSKSVAVEEKLDGANLGISVGDDGHLRFQNRGQYLRRPFTEQFTRLNTWSECNGNKILAGLKPHLILFGEWLAARHSIAYCNLPDWFVAFDVYDREARLFWCIARRDALADELGLTVVPTLCRGHTDLAALTTFVAEGTSQFGAVAVEGIVVRRDGDRFNEARAKLVQPRFVQEIGDHWRRRKIEWNRVGPA